MHPSKKVTQNSYSQSAINWKVDDGNRKEHVFLKVLPNRNQSGDTVVSYYFNGSESLDQLFKLIENDLSIERTGQPRIIVGSTTYTNDSQLDAELKQQGRNSVLIETVGDLKQSKFWRETTGFAFFPTEPSYSSRPTNQSN